tara:strand:+ start:578 stop:766 length:189 start_codon:yes stop_codon:yes gene_type:complete
MTIQNEIKTAKAMDWDNIVRKLGPTKVKAIAKRAASRATFSINEEYKKDLEWIAMKANSALK